MQFLLFLYPTKKTEIEVNFFSQSHALSLANPTSSPGGDRPTNIGDDPPPC